MTDYAIFPVVFQGGPDLSTIENFYERDFYNRIVRQIFLNYSERMPITNPNYIDLWYNSPFYGKITTRGQLCVPRNDKIRLTSSNQGVNSFDFIHDAFNDFRGYILRSISMGTSNLDELFGDFRAKRSFEDSQRKYLAHAAGMMETYNSFLIASSGHVVSVGQYIESFIDFFPKVHKTLGPICFSDFFASHRTPLSGTALSIELSLQSHNEDFGKNKIFKNESLYKYIQAAANFGFRINKNAPWQLVADLKSKPMRTYFNNHVIVSADSLFHGFTTTDPETNKTYHQEPYYVPAMLIEFYLLGRVLQWGYNEYRKIKIYDVKDSFCVNPGQRLKNLGEISIYNRKLP